MTGKKLEILKETIPGLSRVVVLANLSRTASASPFRAPLQTAARSLSLHVTIIDVQRPSDLEGAFRQAVRDRRQAVSVIETAMLFANRAEIAELGRKSRLPLIGEWQLSARAGFLMSYGADLSDLLRRAAAYVDKILKGAKPAGRPRHPEARRLRAISGVSGARYRDSHPLSPPLAPCDQQPAAARRIHEHERVCVGGAIRAARGGVRIGAAATRQRAHRQ